MRLSLFVMIALFAGCDPDKSVTSKQETEITVNDASDDTVKRARDEEKREPGALNPTTCFIRTSGRDTLLLRLERKGSSVSGRMEFDNYQIDGSRGSVRGTIQGDILEFWYDFEAEGMHASRQMFFKLDGERLLWGKGQQVSRNDSTFFVETNNITYSEGLALIQADCNVAGINW